MDYQKFSEFATEDKHLEGPKKRIDEALNLEILITGYKISKSRYKCKNGGDEDAKYLSLQIEIGGEKFVIFTGSRVLAEQVEKYKDKIPFLAKIVKIDRYYSLS
jgi:hypothetical protein